MSAVTALAPASLSWKEEGVIVSAMTRAEGEMLLGLAEVVRRIDVEANIRYLTQAELTSVLNAEAYRYRGLVENSEDTPLFPAP